MPNTCYEINDVLVYPNRNQLQRNGEIVEVTPKSIQILHYLVNSNGELVTYNQLSEHIWGGEVSDGALYQQMTQLRRALGDNPNQPSFIKTLPRQGYKFIAQKTEQPTLQNQNLDQPAALNSHTGYIKPILLLLLIVAIVASYIFINKKPQLQSILSQLQTPSHQIVLMSEDNSQHSASVIATKLLLEFYLEGSDDQHTISVNKTLSNPIIKHIKDYLKPGKLTTVDISQNKNTILLKLQSSDRDDSREYPLTLSREELEIEKIDRWVQEVISTNSLSMWPNITTTSDLSAKASLKEAIIDSNNIARDRAEVEQALDNATLALRLNPHNLLAYSLFFDRASNLLDLSGGFNLDQSLSLIKDNAEKALDISPNYYKAHFALAEVYCNLQQKDLCFKHLDRAVTENPYLAMTLAVLDWNLRQQGINSKKLTYYNYILNPTYSNTRIFYRNRLLETGETSKAIQLMENSGHHYAQVQNDNNWNYLSQASKKITHLQRFSAHYRKNFTRSPAIKSQVPSRYISYELLNSNRPQMAKHWLNNGCDDIGAYLEIQTIDLLIDIWKGEPNQNKWHQIRSLAEDRKKFQDPVDKFRIAFFDYLLGYLQSSKNKLIDIHPSLGNSNLTITRDNFRLSVYYAEILKRQGDFKKASSINKKIRSYLQMSDEFANRGNDLGISDVEFYALNGDKDKAIERLHLAVNHQGWLPNSYWLWLPLNKNPFLKSLSQRQDFQSLNTDITQQLDELCFDRNCNFSARPDSKLI